MPAKIECPTCHQMTYNTPLCGWCGKPLQQRRAEKDVLEEARKKEEDEKDQFGFFQRAQEAFRVHQDIVIARFQAHRHEKDTAGGKRFLVKPKEEAYLILPLTGSSTRLPEGSYAVADLLLRGASEAGPQERPNPQHWVCSASVNTTPIVATFVLPDSAGFDKATDTTRTLNALGLRTSDDKLGGVQLQMSLICEDPGLLLKTFGLEHVEGESSEGQQRLHVTVAAVPDRRGKFRRLWDALCRREAPGHEFYAQIHPFTVAHLYPRISQQLATVVRAAIRNITAQQLYETVDEVARVQEHIERHMTDTLRGLGLRLQGVSAFQFFSPSYDQFAVRRGTVTQAEQDLELARKDVALRGEARTVQHADLRDATGQEAETDRVALQEEARTKALQDRIAAEHQGRKHEMEVGAHAHQLRLKARAEEQERQALWEQGKIAIELAGQLLAVQGQARQQLEDAEHRRKLEAIEAMSKLPPEQQFLMAMTYNPQLQTAFIALQNARAQEDKLAMAQQFQQQLAAIYGTNSEQTSSLLHEAARQLGLVVSKRAEAQRPQIVASGSVLTDVPRPKQD